MRVALVHDWLTGMRGGEKCLEVLAEMFPDAPICTLVHRRGSVSPLLESREIRTSFIQRAPFGRTRYQRYLPLFPLAVEGFDLRGYDLVISSSHAVAKGVLVHPGTRHLCYCHSPMRYVWLHYEEYFGGGRYGFPVSWLMSAAASRLRIWDVVSSRRVDRFVANSRNVAGRIQRYYGRAANVVHPFVDTEFFTPDAQAARGDFDLVVSALVPYKRIDLAIRAAARAGRRLVVMGTGVERRRLGRLARRLGADVVFEGWVGPERLRAALRAARALIFPGEEDFGIVPLEAMACGTPVVAYAAGGALETVIDGETGVFFAPQDATALCAAVQRLEQLKLTPERGRRRAEEFSRARFRAGLAAEIAALRAGALPADVPRAEAGSWAT